MSNMSEHPIKHLSFRCVFKFDKDLGKFIRYWSSKYNYTNNHKYDNNIGKRLSNKSIQELFEWKNGGTLSGKKQTSVTTNYCPDFRGDEEIRYLCHKQGGGAIWNIFFLHCRDREKWPIYDQHTHRAMIYLNSGKIEEIPYSDKQKYKSYKEKYKPFIDSFKGVDQRELDKALFAFGKFLKAVKPYCSDEEQLASS